MRTLGKIKTVRYAVPLVVAFAAFGSVNTVEASPYVVDTFLGSAAPGSSGDATELSTLETILTGLNIDFGTLQQVNKMSVDDDGLVAKPNGDNLSWFMDVDPDTPSYFLVKFGVPKNSGLDTHYFFKNVGELDKLVFLDSDVNNLAGTPCEGCTIERLSHYTSYEDASSNNAVVPVPAALPLLISALGALGLAGWRRGRAASA